MKNETPLHYAAKEHLDAITEILILQGADITSKNHKYQPIILFIFKILIYNKSRKFNKKNKTPLLYYQYKSDQMLKLYQKEESNIKKSNQEESNNNIYRILLRTGKFINAKDSIMISD